MTAPALATDLTFFGLHEPAFDPTPNPRFLHLTPAHAEALAQLLHGVQRRKGFMLLTGEVGTGKTTLLNALVSELGDATAVAFVTNPMLGFDGIIEYMVEDLGIAKPADASLTRRLIALQDFLVERMRTGQKTVLIVDEAHQIEPVTLERIRILSNFETPSEKLLQVVLAGQPELDEMLQLHELRSLNQRIGLRCRIPALKPDQIGAYVRRRLLAAGASDPRIFSLEAIARIAAYSGGIPRVVNTVCDHALTFAYAEQIRRVDRALVDEVIRYLDEARPRRRRGGARRSETAWPKRTMLAASAVLAAVMATQLQAAERVLSAGVSSLSSFARSVRDALMR